MEAEDQALKPCPFCGGTASRGMFSVFCDECGAETNRDADADPGEGARRWNRRADSALQVENARLQRLLKFDHGGNCSAITKDVDCDCGWNDGGTHPEDEFIKLRAALAARATVVTEPREIIKKISDAAVELAFVRHELTTTEYEETEYADIEEGVEAFKGIVEDVKADVLAVLTGDETGCLDPEDVDYDNELEWLKRRLAAAPIATEPECPECGTWEQDSWEMKQKPSSPSESRVDKDSSVSGDRAIFVASRTSLPERGAMWRGFRREGIPITTSSWIDEDGAGETGDWRDLWERIESEIKDSTALVLYAEVADFPLKSAYIEAGIALGFGVPVVICLPDSLPDYHWRPIGSWINHPLVLGPVSDIREAIKIALAQPISEGGGEGTKA